MKENITVARQREILARNIRAQLVSKHVTQTEMARDLKIPQTTVSSWLNGQKYPRLGNIQKMADYFKVSRSVLTEESRFDSDPSQRTVLIPIIEKITCADPIFTEENFSDYRIVLAMNLPTGDLVYLRAKGDSMKPTVPDGSWILIRVQKEVRNDQLAAVAFNDNTEVILRRVKKQGDMLILLPDNNEFEPIIVTEDNPVTIIGLAIQSEQTFHYPW